MADPGSDPGLLLDQLRQSLGLLQIAFDASSEATLILDDACKVRWANQKAADLWASGLAIRMPGQSLERLAPIHALDGHVLATTHASHPLQRMRHGDGQDRYFIPSPELTPYQISWRAIPQRLECFWLLRVRNLAAQEQALFDQQVFLNQLAHELRTPLAILMGSLQRLEREAVAPSKLEKPLQIAREEARRINRLLSQLTILSELDTGLYLWERVQSPCQHLLQGWIAHRNTQPSSDRYRVSGDGLTCPRLLDLDPKALHLVLDNLLDNSLRYGLADAVVEFTASVRGDRLELLVVDQGPGIPDEARPGIFDRFRRLERTRDISRSDGAGLGLAVVKELVEAMDGSVELLPHRQGVVDPGLGVRLCWPLLSDEPG